jgi:hypothetical protein
VAIAMVKKSTKKVAPSKKTLPVAHASLVAVEEANSTKRRQLNRRGSDDVVDRAVEDHFGHLTPFQKISFKVDDMTLRERIASDRNAMPSGKRLGAAYWRALAMQYVCDSDPVTELVPSNPLLEVSDQLVAALSQLHHKNPAARSVEPMIAYLRHATHINETELIGALKGMLAPLAIKKLSIDTMLVEAMRCVVRLDLKSKHPLVIQAVKGHFDTSLAAQFSKLKMSGISLKVFCQCYSKEASLVMDMTDADVVLAADQSWGMVSCQISRLVSSSILGKTMFGFAERHVQAAAFFQTVDVFLNELESTPAITVASVAR